MTGIKIKTLRIKPLESRVMLDASLGALVSSVVIPENTSNAAEQIIDGDVSLTGSTTDFDTDNLTISTTGGAEDQLSINNEGTGANQISVSGNDISYEGTIIGQMVSDGSNGSNLQITLNANASKASIERLIENVTYQNTSDDPKQNHDITISLGSYFSETTTIIIAPENDTLTTGNNNGKTVDEGASITILNTDLSVIDNDNSASELVYTLQSSPTNGQLELTTNAGVAITSFTQDDINNNRLVYVHDASENSADSFTYTATDGAYTLSAQTFNMTINPIDDPLTIDINAGADVSLGFSTSLGSDRIAFGEEVLRQGTLGEFANMQTLLDNYSSQFSLVFTTPASNPTAVPGQVLFESGGSGVGVGLYLNSNNELAWHSGAATSTPRLLSAAPLSNSTQYAVVIEIDIVNDEVRMHYKESSNHNWFYYGRSAEATLTNFTATDIDGSNNAGLGAVGGNSWGGFNGAQSGNTDFQGTIDSDLVLTRFPDLAGNNTRLVTSDVDDANYNIIYTITDDVDFGTITRAGIELNVGDSFTQEDLNAGLIFYNSVTAPGGANTDTLSYSITDGTTTLNDSFIFNVDTVNTAPILYDEVIVYQEDFEGGSTGWNKNTTTNSTILSEFLGRFNRNIHVAGDQELYQTFSLSGSQDYVTIEFDFYQLDSWDNEYFYLFINDQKIRTDRLRWNVTETPTYQETDGVQSRVTKLTEQLGYIEYATASAEQLYHYSLTIATNGADIKFGLGTSLNGTNLDDEAFGIDNVVIKELQSTGGSARSVAISEYAQDDDTVVSMYSKDTDVGQSLTYSITGGTGVGIFYIDADTGDVKIQDASLINYESGTHSYTLDIKVQDNGPGSLSDTQTLTINILDALENNAPVITNQSFSISEGAANNASVGTVAYTDADGDSIELWQIISGNDLGIFKINSTTGEIQINDNTLLNRENDPSHVLQIRAWDDSVLGLYHNRNITINILNVDDAPTLDRQFIGINSGTVSYSADTGNFYRFVNSAVNYATAKAAAEAALLNGAHGHLVVIESVAESNFVDDLINNHVWLGISDSVTEGKWLYTSGPDEGSQLWQGAGSGAGGHATNGFFTYWNNSSEPGTNDNAVLLNGTGKWADVAPTSGYRYVIEWEGTDVANNDTYYVNHDTNDASDINVGDSVGFVQGLDPEGDSLIYSIQGGNADGIFTIDAATGEITIADTTNLDASVLDTYTLTIRVTEANGLNQFAEAPITIVFNENLVLSQNTAHIATEGQTTTITTADLNATDGDGVAADITFSLQTITSNGYLQLSSNPGTGILEFTLDDLQNGLVQYVHNGSETVSDSFTFTISDGGQTLNVETFNINVTPLNDAPIISTHTGTSVAEGGNVTITNTMLNATDTDDTALGLTYTASNYLRGHIEVNGVTQNDFTQDDINNNRVVFVHDGSENATARFDISLADGGEDSASADTATFNLTVTATNDSPTITTNTGFNVVEGGATTLTTAMLNATDPDDSGAGLTYSLSNITNGQVQLSTNLGVPVLSFTQADLSAGRVVFVHDGGELNARFDVSLADGGENSSIADTATIIATRTPVNDSPVISRNLGSSVDAGQITIIKTSVLSATDPDDSGAGLVYTVSNATNGQVELLSNPNVAITSFTQADLQNSQVIFRHDNSFTLSASFDIVLADGGEDTATTDSATFTFAVNNTNDSPTITTNAGGTVVEGQHLIITTAILDSFDPDDFGTGLIYTVTNPSNGHVAFTSDLTTAITSFTQADLDNGIVAFVHDGGETSTASFDIELADGGEHGATSDTATLNFTVTAFNDAPTLIVNDGSPNFIDFNDYSVDPFDNFQDGQGGKGTSASVNPDGTTLTLANNAWKKIDISYTLNANTVLTFEFRADSLQEIHGIGFDNDGDYNNGIFGYQIGGTQTWNGMDQSYKTYKAGDGWVRFDIPIGADFTGAADRLVFVHDNDAGLAGSSYFRNVGFYESNIVLTTNEGGTFNITNAHINSTDPDDNAAGRIFSVSNLANGHIEVNGVSATSFTQDDINNGLVNFVHDGSDTLEAGFDISLADGGEDSAASDNGHFTLIVQPVNDAPTIDGVVDITAAEGSTTTLTTINLQITDSDDIPRDVRINITGTPINGFIALNSAPNNAITSFTLADLQNGKVRYVHNGTETTSDAFTFTVNDNDVTTASATLNLTITPVNDTPIVATNVPLTLSEGATATLTTTQLNLTDPDNTPAQLTISVDTAPVHGYLALASDLATPITSFTLADLQNGDVRYIHDGGESTADGFTFTAGDGAATAAQASFTINITPVNDAPVATTSTNITVDEGTNAPLNTSHISLTDPDNTAAQLTLTLGTAPTHGYLALTSDTATPITSFTYQQLQNGDVVYVHDGGESTADSFTFTATDGSLTTALDTVFIDITPVNDTPIVAINTPLTLSEGATATLTTAQLNLTDPDNTPAQLTISVDTAPTHGYLALASDLATAITSFTLADLQNGDVRYIHDGGESTADGFTFTAGDGTATAAQASFTINITPVNDAPVATTSTNITVDEGTNAPLTTTHIGLTDPDNTPAQLTLTLGTAPTHGYLALTSDTATPITSFTYQQLQNGDVVYVHDGGESTADSFTFTATDGSLTTALDTVFIDITPVNDTPIVATNAPLTLSEGATATLTTTQLNLTDPDNTPAQLTISVDTAPTHGYLALASDLATAITSFTLADLQNGDVRYIHDGGESTTDGFTFTAGDGTATAAQANFTINITPVNDAPVVATNTPLTLNEGATATLTTTHLNVSDSDNSAAQLTVTIDTAPAHGYLAFANDLATPITSFTLSDVQNGNVIYIHDGGESSTDGFTFTAGDGTASATQATFTINILPVNDGVQIVQNTGATLAEGHSITLNQTILRTADSDDTALNITYTITKISNGHIEINGVKGQIFTQDDINNGRVVFVHDGSENTTATFEFTVQDGLENGAVASSGTSTMTITPVNDAPTALWIDETVMSERGAIGETIGRFSSADVDNTSAEITYSIVSDSDDKFMIQGNELVLKNKLNYTRARSHEVTIRATDISGGYFEQTLTIEVEDVSEYTAMPEDRKSNPNNGNTHHQREDDKAKLTVEDTDFTLLNGLVNRGEEHQERSFYGAKGLSQITRTNTTLFINDILKNHSPIERTTLSGLNERNLTDQLQNQNEFTSQETLFMQQVKFMDEAPLPENQGDTAPLSLHDYLVSKSFAPESQTTENTNDETPPPQEHDKSKASPSIKTVQQQFDDIILYNQNRTSRLMQALSENGS